MADLTDIRQGLAALLRGALPEDEGHVSAFWEPAPVTPALQVAGLARGGFDYSDFGGGLKLLFAIEACFSLTVGSNPYRLLDRLLIALPEAVESDATSAGALFSRLQDDGTILTNQAAAAHAVAFETYEGQGPVATDAGKRLLIATWHVEVLA